MVSQIKIVMAISLLLTTCCAFGASSGKLNKKNKQVKENTTALLQVNVMATPSLFIKEYLQFEKHRHLLLKKQQAHLTGVFIRAFQVRFERLSNRGKLELALEEQKYLQERLKLPQFFGVVAKKSVQQAVLVQVNDR